MYDHYHHSRLSRTKQNELAQFFSIFLGHYTQYESQQEYIYDCPECRRRKLSINFGKQVLHCWRCTELEYSLFKFLKEYFPEHIEEFREIISDEVSYDVPDDEPQEPPEKVEYPKYFRFLADNMDNVIARPFINYLVGRGLTQETIEKYKMGYCVRGAFYDRVIIPSYDWREELNYFLGRTIYGHSDRKYMNAKIPKTHVVFNEQHIVWHKKPIVLAEGILDVIAIEQVCGDKFNYSVLLGKSLGESALWDKLLQYSPKIYLALDNDASKDQTRLAKRMTYWGLDVYPLELPEDVEDFGALMVEAQGPGIIRKSIENSRRYDIIESVFR